MKFTLVGMLFLLVGLQSSGQQSTETEMRPDEIIVRLLDWRNGKRVEHEVVSILLRDAKSPSNLLADKGEVAVEVGSAQPRDIRVMPNFFVDCRFKGDSREGRSMTYSVDEIASKGIVTANSCGQIRAAPTPGVLVLYVRSRSGEEEWKLSRAVSIQTTAVQ
jgi:hypothetical protein